MSTIGVHLVNRAKDTPLWTSALRAGITNVLGQLFIRVCGSQTARPVDTAPGPLGQFGQRRQEW